MEESIRFVGRDGGRKIGAHFSWHRSKTARNALPSISDIGD